MARATNRRLAVVVCTFGAVALTVGASAPGSASSLIGGVAVAAAGVALSAAVLRHRRPRAGRAIQASTPDGWAPAEVAMLAYGMVEPSDVAATVIDLAVGGRISIRELGRTAKPDWELTKKAGSTGEMAPFEAAVLAGLFGRVDRIRLSQLAGRSTVDRVQRTLDNDAADAGWFRARPAAARARARTSAIVLLGTALIAASILAAQARSDAVGAGLIIAATAWLVAAWRLPLPAPATRATLAHVASYRRYLVRSTIDEADLAYAMVLAPRRRRAIDVEWYAPASPDPGLERLTAGLRRAFRVRPSGERIANGDGATDWSGAINATNGTT